MVQTINIVGAELYPLFFHDGLILPITNFQPQQNVEIIVLHVVVIQWGMTPVL